MNFPRMNFSKRLLITLAILAILLLIAFFVFNSKVVVRAQNQIKIFPTAYNIESSNGISWQNPQNAFNQDLSDNASFSDFNEENSAFIQGNIEEQTTTTTIPATTTTTEPTTTTIPQETTTTTGSTTTTLPSETTTTLPPEETTTTTIPQETTTTTAPISWLKKFFGFLIPKVNAEENPTLNTTSLVFKDFSLSEDFDLSQIQNVQFRFSLAGKGQEGDKINISYFYQNEWRNLEELDLSQEISNNTNNGYFLYALPIFENPEDLQNLKIKFQVLGSRSQEVYLDSVWLELDYGENIKEKPLLNKHDWKTNEEPEFDFSFPSENNKFLSFFKSLIGKGEIDAFLLTPDNIETQEGIVIQGNKIKIAKLKEFGFRPGLYRLRIKKGDQVIIQEFSWGVLAININKSIYLPNETAYLQMGVLDEKGHTLCDADLTLEITAPDGTKTVFTTDGQQQVAKEPEQVTTTTESTTTTLPEESITTTTTTLPSETTTTAESTTTTFSPEESTTTTIQEETTTTTESTTTTTIPQETTTTTSPISFLKKLFKFLIPQVKAEETTTTTTLPPETTITTEPTTTTTESTTTTKPTLTKITIFEKIYRSSECGPNSVTYTPDYYTYYNVSGSGIYQLKLTAITKNGSYSITDSFEVRDSVPFEIERIGPTRIYPPASYEMKLKIKANQDFNGEIIESVPASFDISIQNTEYRIQNTNQDQKSILWQVNLKTGENIELNYTFDAPDISPYLYLLGPLKIGDFQEIRQWQIASDATTFINVAHYDIASSSSGACDKPANTAENDIMFAIIMRNNSGAVNSVPTDWQLIGEHQYSTTYHQLLYYKVAGASEGLSYTWGFASAGKTAITIATYRGGFNLTDPIDIVSNTEYITGSTTVRAASMNVSTVDSVLLFFATVYTTTVRTFTPPSVPTSDWVEDYDGGQTTSDFSREVASMTWSSSGATGNMDATCSLTQSTTKHAFAVALNPPAPGAPTLYPGDGGSNQIAFNNIRQNSTTPIFRTSATHTGTFNRFQLELNTAADFSGTAYTQDFPGTYTSGNPENLTADGLSPSWTPGDGATYYVRARASADGGTSYSAWSTDNACCGTWSYTYKSASETPDWLQTTDKQYDTDTLVGTETTGSGGVKIIGTTPYIKVQKGEAQLGLNVLLTTVDITPVENQNNAFILLTWRGDDAGGTLDLEKVFATAKFNSNSQIQIERGETAAAAPAVANYVWQVIEADPNAPTPAFTIQTNEVDFLSTDTQKDVTITDVGSTSTVVVFLQNRNGNGDNITYHQFRGKLTSTTNLQINRAASGSTATVKWWIVKFSNDFNVYKGSTTMNAVSSANASIGGTVDLLRSAVFITFDADTNGMAYSMVRSWLGSTSQINFDRGGATGITNIEWAVVEFPSSVSVQSDNNSSSPNTTGYSVDVTISAITQANTFSVAANKNSGTGTAWPRGITTNYLLLSSTTDLQLKTGYSGTTNTWTYYVIDTSGWTFSFQSGTIMSPEIDFDWVPGATSWYQFDWSENEDNGTVKSQLWYDTTPESCDACNAVIPNSALSDNEDWFTIGARTISGLDTDTYNCICIKAQLDDVGGTPYLLDWTVTWELVAPGTPTVSNVKLNSQNNIDLMENSTSSVSATADVSDSEGCSTITGVTAKIYRSGVLNGKDCTANENNCYSVALCTINNCVGDYASTTCSIDMWFDADPTDSGTPWVDDYWMAYIEATDDGSLTGSGYSPADVPDVNSLLALSVTGSIGYGSLNPGDKNDPLDKITTVTATGNISLDVTLYGTQMCTDYPTCADNTISVGKQKYALSASTSYSSGTSLLIDPGVEAELNCSKTTDSSNKQTKDIWWGIEIPTPQTVGSYTGSNTFIGKTNETPWP